MSSLPFSWSTATQTDLHTRLASRVAQGEPVTADLLTQLTDDPLDVLGRYATQAVVGTTARARQAGTENAQLHMSNLVAQAIRSGQLDGTNPTRVAAAIRADTPKAFRLACTGQQPQVQ